MKELHSTSENKREKAYLVGIRLGRSERLKAEADLDELRQLVSSADVEVVGSLMAPVSRPDPAWYVGKGKVEEIAEEASTLGAQVVVFDEPLSPAQVRNLEKRFERKVIDRGNVVLDIFANRARTREAITQVELAQLEYLLPRLTGMWEHFSRHVGGVGTKGPGETQLETDRRLTRTRIAHLKKSLKKIAQSREVQRTRRLKNVAVCSLVGYTNAGKSTLFNALSRAEVVAENRMFSSLDAKTKKIFLSGDGVHPGRQVVLVDTVGFVSKLPPQLVASFRSTLEEIKYSDLLLGILDASHPEAKGHLEAVKQVVGELGASDIPRLWVVNKADIAAPESLTELGGAIDPDPYLTCSALTGQGVAALSRSIRDRLTQ